MNTSYPIAAKIGSLLLAGLTINGEANAAQTTLFYANAGSGSFGEAASFLGAGNLTAVGNLASIGYDSYSWNTAGSGSRVADSADGIISARENVNAAARALHLSFNASVPEFDAFGGALQSVTIFLYVTAVTPDFPSGPFTVRDGIDGSGNPIVPLSLAKSDQGSFFSFTLTATQFNGGFSIVAPDQPALTNAQLNIGGENAGATNPLFTPGVLATYAAVPEPSMALLGTLGVLGFLRRCRTVAKSEAALP